MERDFVVESLRGPGGCPGTAELGAYLDGRAPEWKAHVPDCPHCQAELAMMREMLSGNPVASESADVNWVAGRIRRVTAGETAAAIPWWRSWFQVGPALAALLLVVSVGTYLRRAPEPGEVRYGGPGELRSSRIAVTGPVGTLAARPSEFVWEPVAGAVRYEVAVEEVSRDTVWQGASPGTRVAIPAEVTAKMLPGKTLVWRVIAFDGQNGKLAESEMTRFRMEPPK